MKGSTEEKGIVHEVALVVPKRTREEEEEADCVEVLVTELKKRGMIVDRVVGLADEFLKVCFFTVVKVSIFSSSSCLVIQKYWSPKLIDKLANYI